MNKGSLNFGLWREFNKEIAIREILKKSLSLVNRSDVIKLVEHAQKEGCFDYNWLPVERKSKGCPMKGDN